jgi:hypothetical protein
MASPIFPRSAGLLLLLALLVLPAQAQQQTPTPEASDQQRTEQAQAATQAAEKWLVYVDESEYTKSYEEASEMLQEQVTSERWAQGLLGVESQAGALNERTLQGARYTTQLPNAPEGEYVVVQYMSEFAKAQAQEVVLMMRENDAWKVAGYFVRPAQGQQGAPPQQGGGGQ